MAKIETDWQKALKKDDLTLANWAICECEGYSVQPNERGHWELYKDGKNMNFAGHRTKGLAITNVPNYILAPLALQQAIIDTCFEGMTFMMSYEVKKKLWSVVIIMEDGLEVCGYEHSQLIIAMYYVYMMRKGQFASNR